jgi:formylglycine-generating enzyme required for sulfatase activity
MPNDNAPYPASYLDFELEIGPGSGREYPVAVVRSPAGEAHETLRFPFDELALESRLKDLQITLLRSGGKRRQSLSQEEQAVQQFGRALFDSLLIGEVRSRYDVSQSKAAQQGKGLRFKLRIQSPELAALPWEFLYDARQAEYVCLSRNTPVVRYLELPQPILPLTVTPPLRILGMIASPADLPPLDVTREKQRVEQATQALRQNGLMELTWLEGQTWRDLQRAMRSGPWHVFHFIGHGGFDPHQDEGLIVVANEQGQAYHLTATQLGRLLADHRSLRLVLLNACEGARGSTRDIFSSTASILVRRGIPAVLAMQYEITDQAAIEFARAFYEALADEMPVDASVAEARKAVSLEVNNTVEWGTPVLYMRSPDGMLFNLAAARQAKEAARAARLAREQAEREAREKAAQEEATRKAKEAERLEQEQQAREAKEQAARLDAERLERERLAREQAAREEAERQAKLVAEKTEAERLERERQEREAQEKAAQLEAARQARLDAQKAEAARQERERQEREVSIQAAREAERQARETARMEKTPSVQESRPRWWARLALPAAGVALLMAVAVIACLVGSMIANNDAANTAATQTAIAARPTQMVTARIVTAVPPTTAPVAPGAPTQTLIPTPPPTQLATSTPGPGATRIADKDGMVMLYVPAGEFLMGSADSDKDADSNEKPQHKVYLDAYWIDQTEVTNSMFARFVSARGYKTDAEKLGSGYTFSGTTWPDVKGADWQHPGGPDTNIRGLDTFPVVLVSWNDAQAYCEWAVRQLPTEAQWEKAARGTDGRLYPWGNTAPDSNRLNFTSQVGKTTEVGKYPTGASPYGAYDMAGNVWEWVADWYDEKYYGSSPPQNPTGPTSGSSRVLRGGSWFSVAQIVRSAYRGRNTPEDRYNIMGFRCSR